MYINWEWSENADGYYVYLNGSYYDTAYWESYDIYMEYSPYDYPEYYYNVVWEFYVVAYNSSGTSAPSPTAYFSFNDYYGFW